MRIKPNNINLDNEDISEVSEEDKKKLDEEWEDYYEYKISESWRNIDEKTINVLCKYLQKPRKEILKSFCEQNDYGLDIDEETLDVLQNNYPQKTKKEIIETLEGQRNYSVSFHHKHDWISEDLIKKYLLLDDYDSDVVEITIDTPEVHDCNLVELTPELQDKAYRWYRWNRNIISHLINRVDYSKENKTNKLTIVGKRESDSYYDYGIDSEVEGKPYFLVITAFWWDGSALREPRHKWYEWNEDMVDSMEYWMNHALITEEGEPVYKTDTPPWVIEMEEMKKWNNG